MALRAGRVGVHPSQVDPNGKVKAGLTPEQQAKLDRALLTPVSAPVETEFVAISTGREQLNIGVGDGLAIENNKLKALGGGSTSLSYVRQTVSHNGKFTATNNGTAILHGYLSNKVPSGATHLWVNDLTSDIKAVGFLNKPANTQGYMAVSFPVIKDHEYQFNYYNGTSQVGGTFFNEDLVDIVC